MSSDILCSIIFFNRSLGYQFLYVPYDFIFTLIQVSTFADMEGEETFEPSFLGSADEVVEERISDDAVVMIKGTKTTSAVSNLIN